MRSGDSLRIDQLPIGSSVAATALILGAGVRSTTDEESQAHSTGLGDAKLLFSGSLFGVDGVFIALFGAKTQTLIGVSWTPNEGSESHGIAGCLGSVLGEPTEISEPHRQTEWSEVLPSVDVILTSWDDSCSVQILTSDPWEY
jgi:hypothetical protein